MAETSARIMLADDHAMLREGLRRSLVEKGFDVVGEAANGQQAIDVAEVTHPDVILMDLTMPVLDGMTATRKIVQRMPNSRVVILTMHADPQLAKDALAAGAMGYLVKDCTTDEIVGAIRNAINGEASYPSSESIAVEAQIKPQNGERPIITAREAEVLQLIANGLTTSQAAQALFVSLKTVKNHLASAYAKLEAHDRTQAVLRAARLGLIELKTDHPK